MQISIKKDTLRLVISDATAEECILVLNNTGLLNEVKSVRANRQYNEVEVDDQQIHHIENINALEENTESLNKVVITRPTTETTELIRKKLVFTKCERCDHVVFKMIDMDDTDTHTLRCACGTHIPVSTSSLVPGKYECACGTRGSFLMTDNVTRVHCKGCDTPMYMEKDLYSDCYVGQSFTELMNRI